MFCFCQHLFSKKIVKFNSKKSLYENFLAMCRLPLYRKHETNSLIKLIKLCDLYSTTIPAYLLSHKERHQDIATIELCILFLDDWSSNRKQKNKSDHLIQNFYQEVKLAQKKLIQLDYQIFLTERTLDYHEPQIWKNMLFCRENLKEYLSPAQQNLFNSLENKIIKNEGFLSAKFTQFSYAIFMPILNYFNDLDLVFDGFNCLDLVK